MTAADTPRAIVFDLDGTLIHSAPSMHRAVIAVMAELGHPAPDLATMAGFVGDGVPTLMARCERWAGIVPTEAAVTAFRRHYDADPVTGTQPLGGAVEVLADLHRRGIALGLCTNKPEAPTRTLLAGLGLGPFGAIAGGDTLPVRKPDPAPLLHVIAALGMGPGETLFVGDSAVDQRTAAAAGIAYVHISEGYGDPDPDAAEPHLILARLADLPTALFP